MRVNCLGQENNTTTLPGPRPRLFNPEFDAPTKRMPCFFQKQSQSQPSVPDLRCAMFLFNNDQKENNSNSTVEVLNCLYLRGTADANS